LTIFGDEIAPTALVLELSGMKMDAKERIKDFNKKFTNIFNKKPGNSRLSIDVQVECYTSALPTSIAMFVKRDINNTFVEGFQEAIDVEKEIIILKGNPNFGRKESHNQL